MVNVSSEAGSLAAMGGDTPAYRLSKAALNAITRMLASELRKDGILVNAVCPGWVATDMGGSGGRPVTQGAAAGSSATAGPCRGEGRSLPPERDQLAQTAVAQPESQPGHRAEGDREQEPPIPDPDLARSGAAEISRHQDRTQDRRAGEEV